MEDPLNDLRILVYEAQERGDDREVLRLHGEIVDRTDRDTSNFPHAIAQRAGAHAVLGQCAEALRDYDAAIHMMTHDPGTGTLRLCLTLSMRAHLHQRMLRHDLAAADEARILELNPTAFEYIYRRDQQRAH